MLPLFIINKWRPAASHVKVADKDHLQHLQHHVMQFYFTRRCLQTSAMLQGSRYYNPIVSLTMMKNAMKNLERSLQNELERQKKELARRGPRTVAKNPTLYDNRRTKVFNRQFQENIGFVMSSIPELLGKGVTVTKVSVTTDFTEVRVFWVCTAEKDETVTNLLETYAAKIKQDIKEVSGLGLVPRIQWIHDQNYILQREMDKIFEKVKNNEVHLNLPDDDDDVNVWKVCYESLQLECEGSGLDRDNILTRIETEKNKKEALHRSPSQYTQEDFQTVYRESIHRNGLENKLLTKDNIRKFLTNRKKMLKSRE